MSIKSGTSKAAKPQQARDNVRDMLINKMLAKYNKYPNATDVICSRVAKFMNQSRITDANLKKLEKEILDELTAKPKKPVPVKASSKEVKEVKATYNAPVQSAVVVEPEANQVEEEFEWEKKEVPYHDDKDWNAILKFNEKVYKEDLKKEEEAKVKRKQLLKEDLERQIEERQKYKKNEKEGGTKGVQDYQFEKMMNKDKERTMEKEKQKKVTKEMLDQQVKEEVIRKHMDIADKKEYEKQLLAKARKEEEIARLSQEQKKEEVRKYHQKIMEENEVYKKKHIEEEKKKREKEKKELEEYTRLLEKQDAERLEKVKMREKRTQEFMDRMADSTIKKENMKRDEEDKRVQMYQETRDKADKLDEEKRNKRLQDLKSEMKAQLDQQIQEKKNRSVIEKDESKRLAESWQKDISLYNEQEKKLKEKSSMGTKDYAEYLKMQMEENKKRKKNMMNREEYLMNKNLIEAAEKKLSS